MSDVSIFKFFISFTCFLFFLWDNGYEVLMMKPHLIVCDLDGSLLNKEGHITELTKKTLTLLTELGHTIVLATGRPYGGAIDTYNELNLYTPLITDNGGSIDHPKDPKFARQKTYIPLFVMHELFRFAKPFIISSFYTEDGVVYAYQYDERLEDFFSGINSGIVIDKEMTEYTVPPTGLIYLIKSEFQKNLEQYIDLNFKDIISYRLWGVKNNEAMYEIYLRHVSKASAIRYVIECCHLENHVWLSIGDGVNDIDMIKDAHIGVAMKNAVPELFNVCKDVTTYDHDDEGLAKYLIHRFNLHIT